MSTPSSTPTASPVATLEITTPRRDLLADAIFRLRKNKASMLGLAVIIFFTLVAIFAPIISPHNPLQINSGKDYLSPFWMKESDPSFALGTDTLGRDVLSRVIYGSRVSMVIGFLPTIIILIIGTVVGLYSGYRGGMMDNILMRLTDVIYAFPDILFFIIVMISLRDTFIGKLLNGLFLLFLALSFVNWVSVARLVRGQVLSLKEKEFVEAARCIGATDTHIMFRHIMPNSLGPIIIWAAFSVPGMIITEATLGYLGIGLRPTTDPDSVFITSWGSMLLDGQTAINSQPWILLSTAICVSLVVLAFTFLGDGLRDALDPRLQGTQ